MRIPRIFTDQSLITGQIIQLETQASSHIARVLRLKADHPVVVFNGQGGHFDATIASVEKKTVHVKLGNQSFYDNESPLKTHLAIGVSKGDKMDLIVQKATELGAHSVTPLVTQRSDVKLNPDRWQKKHQHWQQVAISACEQSQRDEIPVIHPVTRFSDWITAEHNGVIALCHPKNAQPLTALQPSGAVTLAFGSEGGFSDEEVVAAAAKGIATVGLGPRILRAETAPIAALAVCQSVWGDW